MRPSLLLLVLPSAYSSFAFQLPFGVPHFLKSASAVVIPQESPSNPTTPRIAIIGAGAGGSSAAFWISKAKQRFGLDVEVDVYEKSDYIGGRSTVVYPHNDKAYPAVELGASIFVRANKNLWRASEEFQLNRTAFDDIDAALGIWDGENLLFTYKGGWWDTAKLLWRYGYLSPTRTDSIVQKVIQTFVTLYNPTPPKWTNVSALATEFEWTSLTEQTTKEYLESQGVSSQYIDEFVDAATRVNYGQDVDEIHALEGACSMATAGAAGIIGGNFQMFEKFLESSGANVKLNTAVTSITPSTGSTTSQWTVSTKQGSNDYQAVIIAAPIHQTGITLPSEIISQVPEQPYVHLHVTLLTTTLPSANPAYFGLSSSGAVPGMLLTSGQGFRNGGKAPEFNSLSYHGAVKEGEWAVKIFSQEKVEDEWLNEMFNGTVTWVYRKEWQAYPKLPPTSTFPPVQLEKGLYYVNAFEPFISTMETETISSRNVVDLLLNEEFDSGICSSNVQRPSYPSAEVEDAQVIIEATGESVHHEAHEPKDEAHQTPVSKSVDDKDFVYGWDC
ncbi:hypothetical protein BDN72DRAFT_890547 [Pluteus cervinus]|uniref:Uncharacterized protein n=1 Tax=Pluteus cervinus TaxID=181527 RepID=A0ACD3BI60_9AGAR|nr:hypothetical protein BDN72DRAFT_890547 [Pluteus cervinus]